MAFIQNLQNLNIATNMLVLPRTFFLTMISFTGKEVDLNFTGLKLIVFIYIAQFAKLFILMKPVECEFIAENVLIRVIYFF